MKGVKGKATTNTPDQDFTRPEEAEQGISDEEEGTNGTPEGAKGWLKPAPQGIVVRETKQEGLGTQGHNTDDGSHGS